MSHWERLSALDASFLGIETERSPMHVGALAILEGGPLVTEDGGVDFPTIRRYFESALSRLPRYRQKLMMVPGIRHPVWVDDEHFNIHFHLRHTALPRPGDDRLLKRLAGRIFSQRLDRTRPLWEMWIVEGLTGGRFAMISKIHHCMIDGVAGAQLMTALLRGTTDATVPDADPWEPRPVPGRTELLAAELEHRALGSRNVLDRLRNVVRHPREWWDDAHETVEGITSSLRAGIVQASPTPLNPKKIGPYRRFDVCTLELAAVKRIKDALGVKLNDVVLAIAAGALARFFERRGVDPTTVEDCRAMIPVNVRKRADHGAGGNKVAMMVAELPVAERDPATRLARVHEITSHLKNQSHQIEGSELIEEIADLTATSLLREVFRAAGRQRAYNIVITNVPGPPFPLYLLGSRITEVYPLVPLFENQAAGIALFSYAGSLHWGLIGDWQSMPDLYELTTDIEASFAELSEAAAGAELSDRAPAP